LEAPKNKSVKVNDVNIANNIIVSRKVEVIYALRNIIDNALKFANQKIEIEIYNQGKKIGVNINDDGEGFPQDVIQKLGEPYIKSALVAKNKSGLGTWYFYIQNIIRKNWGKNNI
jgi:Histidine kinase-, DNA gyrase B-, and HSP90-like ATPase.